MRINLLPKDERPLKQSAVRWEFVVGIIGILALAAVITFTALEHVKINALTATKEEYLDRAVELQIEVAEVNQIKQRIANLKEKALAYQSLMVEHHPSLPLVPAITKHPFPRIWIESMDWAEAGVNIKGYTQNMTSLSQYLYFLNERSEEALLAALSPRGDNGFREFSLKIKGVGGDVQTESD